MLIPLRDKIESPLAYKEECLALIGEIISLSESARSFGLQALDKYLLKKDNFFLTDGLQMIKDGVDPAVLYFILNNYLSFSSLPKKDITLNYITLQGLILVMGGHHPFIIKKILLSFLGLKAAEAYSDMGREASVRTSGIQY